MEQRHGCTHLSLLLPGEVAVGVESQVTLFSCGVVHNLHVPRLEEEKSVSIPFQTPWVGTEI